MIEKEVIQKLSEENEDFKRLVEEHRLLDTQIEELSRKKYLTPNEDLQKKEMKKQKLVKKDKIAEMTRTYQESLN